MGCATVSKPTLDPITIGIYDHTKGEAYFNGKARPMSELDKYLMINEFDFHELHNRYQFMCKEWKR